MPPHHCAVISGLVGPNGTSPAQPDPIIPNGTPDPELVTIGTDCEADGVTIVVQTVWLQEERGLSLCRPVAGMKGSTVEPKR